MLDTDSLAATLDAVKDALFFGREISAGDRRALSKWLVERCGQPGSYEFMPAPTPQDFAGAPRVFTGEVMTSKAGMACKLGSEGCRALLVLGVETEAVSQALATVREHLGARLADCASDRAGYYCCGSCSVAFWRHLMAGGMDNQQQRLARGVELLRSLRDEKGGWRSFPTWYTIWALTDMDSAAARAELEYVAPKLERQTKRRSSETDKYATRRTEIARRALARI
jgi:hypothetical protein